MTDLTRIELLQLISLSESQQLRIREIRNQEAVRKWMYTDHLISTPEHLAWIERLRSDDRQIVLAVVDDGRPVGLVSLNAIDHRNSRADWAYYLDESARGGLGAAIEYAMMDFVFDRVGLNKLNCEVIEGNDTVVKLHGKFGFKDEGFRRAHIKKNGMPIGVHFLGITADEWRDARDGIREKYGSVFGKYEVTIRA